MKKSLLVIFAFCLLMAGCGPISGAYVDQTALTTHDDTLNSVTSQGCSGLRIQLAEDLSNARAIRADLNDPTILDQGEQATVRTAWGKLQRQILLIQTELGDCPKQ